MNNKPPPVVYIICGKNPLQAKSGYASYTYNLAKTFKELQFKPKIFCLGDQNKIIQAKIGEVHLIKSNLLKIPFIQDQEMLALPFLSVLLAIHLYQELKNQKSIVWGIGPWSLAAAFLKLIGLKFIFITDYFTTIKHESYGAVSAVNIRDYGWYIRLQTIIGYHIIIPIYSLLERLILEKSDKIITHYRSTEKIILKQFKIPKSKFFQTGYQVEINSSPLNQKTSFIPSSPLILLICRHDPRKGINFLLHACSILNQRGNNYSVTIIGAGKLLSSHQKLAQRLGLKNVRMLGYVPNLSSFIKQADLYVFPSIEEGSSALSILEAMKAGLPIVATHVDGIPEDLENGKSALLVPPKNPLALADALEKLLKNKSLAQKLGTAAQLRYQTKFSETKVKRSLELFLARFL